VPGLVLYAALTVVGVGIVLPYLSGNDAWARRLGLGMVGVGAIVVGTLWAWLGFVDRRSTTLGIYASVPGVAIAIGGLWMLSEAMSGQW
jgi:hypothetical protein